MPEPSQSEQVAVRRQLCVCVCVCVCVCMIRLGYVIGWRERLGVIFFLHAVNASSRQVMFGCIFFCCEIFVVFKKKEGAISIRMKLQQSELLIHEYGCDDTRGFR